MPGLTRRDLLRTSAAAAGLAALAACSPGTSSSSNKEPGAKPETKAKGSETKPMPTPAKFAESPKLTELAKAGKIPALAERLPEKPYVIPHRWVKTGQYGGNLQMILGDDPTYAFKEYMYGHSILRFLNDGLDIGPGLAESWESNEDATVWTFHFRKGLKWSDGEPWSTADIMYWWEDMVLNEQHPDLPPDDTRSGRDTVAKVTAPDETTLVLTFDAPAPITPERLAAWTNRGNGPRWMEPKHYLSQFHPKYNKKIKASSNWYDKHDSMSDWSLNKDCPTMTGWRLKSYNEGRNATFERNPYYWCVDTKGNQLPYVDELRYQLIPDQQVQKLKFIQGAADYVHGGHTDLILGDVQALRGGEKKTGVQLFFWDGGSGTGSILFWNQDHPDPEIRKVFRDKKFRQALSHAYNRPDVRKGVYFNSGELTTGTLSPKGAIFSKDAESKKRYAEWRDSYVKYDPEKAKAMLDELGMVDKNGDGMRELPNGKKFLMLLDYPADAGDEHKQKNEFVKRSWEAVGIATQMNPVSPDTFGDRWGRGELMTTTAWEVGDNSPLIYPGWVIPVETGHWAPLHGKAFQLQTGDPGALKKQANVSPWKRTPPWIVPDNEKEPVARLWDLYAKARVETDELKRTQLLWDVVKIHVEEGPFFLGAVANVPRIVLAHQDLQNVPRKENLALGGWVNPWILPSPAVYDPETYFWSNPDKHST
ncbi:ABC transporter substrate-binding protein [Flindersiella endophytica]